VLLVRVFALWFVYDCDGECGILVEVGEVLLLLMMIIVDDVLGDGCWAFALNFYVEF
jgi:hypothetical protein